MGQISSINFKASNAINLEHNDRTLAPSYIVNNGNFKINRSSAEARELKQRIINEAKEAYNRTTKQRFQAKSYEWSAVVNLKPDSTMADVEQLAEHFQNKYGFQCYQIAIHRDEGHIDDNGNLQINHHAHLEFITLDKNTGKSLSRTMNKTKLREIQSEVAQILQMERGIDKRLSGVKRIEPRAYAQIKEKEKRERKQIIKQELEKLSEKEIKARIEIERKKWIQEGGHIQEDYHQLKAFRALMMQQGCKTSQELEAKIQKFHDELSAERKKSQQKDIKITQLQDENQQLRAENTQIKNTNAKLIKQNNEKDNAISSLIDENISLKRTIDNFINHFSITKHKFIEIVGNSLKHLVDKFALLDSNEAKEMKEINHEPQQNDIRESITSYFEKHIKAPKNDKKNQSIER